MSPVTLDGFSSAELHLGSPCRTSSAGVLVWRRVSRWQSTSRRKGLAVAPSILLRADEGHRIRRRAPSPGPNGGVADSLDEAKAAFRAAVGGAPRRCAPAESRPSPASAFFGKSGRDMLSLSLSVDDPGCVKTLYFIMIGVVPAL
jgi:hypothetical protein